MAMESTQLLMSYLFLWVENELKKGETMLRGKVVFRLFYITNPNPINS
jgi:hypothetical protein